MSSELVHNQLHLRLLQFVSLCLIVAVHSKAKMLSAISKMKARDFLLPSLSFEVSLFRNTEFSRKNLRIEASKQTQRMVQ